MPSKTTLTDVTISIGVDTDALWAKPYPNTSEADVDDCTFISDGITTSQYHEPSKNMETEVSRGNKVRWTIASQNVSKIYVSLLSVTHNPTPNNPYYFDHNPLNVEKFGAVDGTIMNIEKLPDEAYSINFKLFKEGGEVRNYTIDPKLKIRTRQ
jgi:hypothetical protein